MRKLFLIVGTILIIGVFAWRTYFTDFRQQSAQKHFKVAEDYYHRGELEPAIANMETAVREDPTFIEARDALGTLYQVTGHRDKELQLYREWVQLYPNGMRAHYTLGTCYYRNHQYAECATEMARCLEIGPYNPQYLHLLGMSYEKSGRLADAQALWQKAAKEHADDEIIKRGLTRTARKLASGPAASTPEAIIDPTRPRFKYNGPKVPSLPSGATPN